MGTWNSALIGGLLQGLGRTVGIKSTSAVMLQSAFPGKRFTRHTIACCSGSYFARPKECLIFALAVFFGTGILITTWVANSWSEKLAITLRLIETLKQKKNRFHVRHEKETHSSIKYLVQLTLSYLVPLVPLG